LARARDSVKATRRAAPPTAGTAPTYVFVPTHPAQSQRVSGDASSFRWGFGLMFGTLCAVVAFIVLSCMGLGFLAEATKGGSGNAKPAARPAASTPLPVSQRIPASSVLGDDGKLRLEVSNVGESSERRIVVLVESKRVSGHAVRVTFDHLGAGESAEAVVESAVLQRDAQQGMLPAVRVVEPEQ
jgi:hypothetical protein